MVSKNKLGYRITKKNIYFALCLLLISLICYYIILPFISRISAENLLSRSIDNTVDYKDMNATIGLFNGNVESDLLLDKSDVRLISRLNNQTIETEFDMILKAVDGKNSYSVFIGLDNENEIMLDSSSVELEFLDNNETAKSFVNDFINSKLYINISDDEQAIFDLKENLIKSDRISETVNAIYNSLVFSSHDNIKNKSVLNYGIDKDKLIDNLSIVEKNVLKTIILDLISYDNLVIDKNLVVFVIDSEKNKLDNITVNVPQKLYNRAIENTVLINNFVSDNSEQLALVKLLEIDFVNISDNLEIKEPENTIDHVEVIKIYESVIGPNLPKQLTQLLAKINKQLLSNE